MASKKINIKTRNVREYLEYKVRVFSASLSNNENRLTKSLQKFFVDICYLNYLGWDVSDHQELKKGLREIGSYTNDNTISVNKSILGARKWMRTGFNGIKLTKMFDLTRPDYEFDFGLQISYDETGNEEQLPGSRGNTGRGS